MASIDLIMKSIRAAWAEGDYTALVPAAAMYLDRAEKPSELAGFPFQEVYIEELRHEIVAPVAIGNSLVWYRIDVDTFTVQGMTGGSTTGSQVTDQGIIQRALEAILNFIPPNTAWQSLPLFRHCIRLPGLAIRKDDELYRADVMKSRISWELFTLE